MIELLPDLAVLKEFSADTLAMATSVALVASYYLNFHRRARRNPACSIHAVNANARRLWVRQVMTQPGKDVMAVQTLRNFIMVGIMMASTASLLVMGTLTLSGQAENIARSWHVLGFLGSSSPGLWIVKVMVLLADFIVAFFGYAMAIRLANHVLFMINVPHSDQDAHAGLSPDNVADRLIQAGNMMALGMRAFLFAIPLVFWLFGPLFLLLATAGLIVTLSQLDRHDVIEPGAAEARPAASGLAQTLPFRRRTV
ncbi:DUF599 domain-containing protein [Parasulfuritortus cantonensis]|uniref:DUF599 domain-containing protein n=1 Tax=Parasulfuritortus cantonensis TaxID=2528202 RepID=A0A4R1B0Q1_9PROT|nr:DUF599 domain-containing protein [Parasulfuritortus cantonensis]TCJ11534.1 DUF599 domain-containing protein [Parasulfuritortus cantonensis]